MIGYRGLFESVMNKRSKQNRRRYVPDLSQDLASCDANYIRMLKLFPSYVEDDERRFALEVGGLPTQVDLEVIERCTYTTFINLTVSGGLGNLDWLDWPKLSICLYHDLSTAEVLTVGAHEKLKQRYELPNAALHHPDEKSQVNRALGELLASCIEHGRMLESVLVLDD